MAGVCTTADFHNGLNLEFDGELYTIIWFQHHKPGKGGAVMRTKLKNLKTGGTIEQSFKSGEKFREIDVDRVKKQYLYNDGETYNFMDNETYDQFTMQKSQVGEIAAKFLKENMEVQALYLDGKLLTIELPITIEVKVINTVPGERGNTVANVTKPATVETGAVVQVPLFIEEGELIKVDTRTGEYVERA
jgi:elongation factor P